MKPKTKKNPVCPQCKAPIQATKVTEEYFTLVAGKWVLKDRDVVQIRVYCKNDHVAHAQGNLIRNFPSADVAAITPGLGAPGSAAN